MTMNIQDRSGPDPLAVILARQPAERRLRGSLAYRCIDIAWGLANRPESIRDPQRALVLARRAVELAPRVGILLKTLGACQYRAGHYGEAITALERSRAIDRGRYAGIDLFFMAMAYHRPGHRAEARGSFDHAIRWVREQKGLPEPYTTELSTFRAEAEALLAGPAGEMPDDVFEGP
jgi:tetratricopeptide (TPR) repeat protein